MASGQSSFVFDLKTLGYFLVSLSNLTEQVGDDGPELGGNSLTFFTAYAWPSQRLKIYQLRETGVVPQGVADF
jgi:hypothetical protein